MKDHDFESLWETAGEPGPPFEASLQKRAGANAAHLGLPVPALPERERYPLAHARLHR